MLFVKKFARLFHFGSKTVNGQRSVNRGDGCSPWPRSSMPGSASSTNGQHRAMRMRDYIVRGGPWQVRVPDLRSDPSAEDNEVRFAFQSHCQDALRGRSIFEYGFRQVLQNRIQRNQFTQATESVLDWARAATQLGVVFDDMQQRKPRAELFGQRHGLLGHQCRVEGELRSEQDLAYLEFE